MGGQSEKSSNPGFPPIQKQVDHTLDHKGLWPRVWSACSYDKKSSITKSINAHTLIKLLVFLNQKANTITKLKTIHNSQFLAAFAEILVIGLERIKHHTEKWVLLQQKS